MTKEIIWTIHHAEAESLRISFCWILGRDVVGNEKVGAAAKEATLSESNPTLGLKFHNQAALALLSISFSFLFNSLWN